MKTEKRTMNNPRSIYSYGANDGLKMGLYLSVMFVLQSIGMSHPTLMIFGTLMMICIPVVAYIILRKGYRESGGFSTFSAIWLHGILTFLCGSLILALVIYVYLRFLDPTFMSDLLNTLIESYGSMDNPQAAQLTEMLTTIKQQHLLPSPIQYAFTMIWTCGFFGSLLSMILALIVRAIPIRKEKN